MSNRDYDSADLQVVLGETFGHKPNVERFGDTLGLAIDDSGTRPLEAGARGAAMDAVTVMGRELVTLGQTRAGMDKDTAEEMANDVCTRAYETASKRTAYESDRFGAAIDAIRKKSDELKRKTPLVTESQSGQIRHVSESWKPERVKISENRQYTGQDAAPTMDQQIINALEGRG